MPSAISKRIAAIEEDIGAPLLKRGRRGIEPTAAGQALLTRARDILVTMERLHAELAEFASGVRGSVRVFASISALSEFLPDDIGSFLAQHAPSASASRSGCRRTSSAACAKGPRISVSAGMRRT